jgi:hypothetical protein
MTNGVDAGMQSVEATDHESVFDCVFAEPKLPQLTSRNHSMLCAGKRRDRSIAASYIASLS